MAVSVRLFYAGQRLNKEFFRDPDADSGSKRRRGSQADDTPLDGKGLLKLFAKGALSAEELAAIGPLMRKQEFIGVSVGLENAGNDVDLRALRNAIMHGSIKPSGVIREVPADADGVCRIPPAHQDTGIAFEMQFNSQEELRKAVELFQTAIQENEDKKLTWYARIAGCCHRHIAAGDFWRKYDVFKYDFDLAPRLHLVFHPNAVSYSLLASWPCRLKGDSVYQRFALQSPFVSPVVETVPPGSCPPRCDCTARSAPATTNSHSTTGGGGTAMPAAAAAPAPRLKSKGVTYDTVVAFETTPLRSSNPDAIRSSNPDALFGMPLPPAYHFGTAGTTPAMLLATSCPSTPPTPAVAAITPLPPAMDVDFLSSLSPDCFLLTNLDTVQAIEKAAAGSHFFADMAWSSAV